MSADQQEALDYIDRAKGRSIVEIIGNGIAGWILSMFAAMIAGFQTIFDFLFLPFEILIDVATASADAFIIGPFDLVGIGTDVSATAIRALEGFAGLIGLPVAVVVVLGTLLIVITYLQLGTSSNLLPGLFVDNRVVDFFFTSPEEEAEGED